MEYTVNRPTVIAEIGDAAEEVLQELCRKLHCPWATVSCRAARSLNARSEAALFGISSPRFVYRGYLTKERTSFVNVRRLVNLAATASKSCGQNVPKHLPATIKPAKANGSAQILGD